MIRIRGSHAGRGGGRGRRFRGGRPRVQPRIDREWSSTSGEVELKLTKAELEALRLVDKDGLTQEQAAERMQISRGSLWRILQEGRIKVISALTAGKSHIHLLLLESN